MEFIFYLIVGLVYVTVLLVKTGQSYMALEAFQAVLQILMGILWWPVLLVMELFRLIVKREE